VITPATSTAAGKQITYTDLQTDKLAKAPIGWRHTPYLPAMLKRHAWKVGEPGVTRSRSGSLKEKPVGPAVRYLSGLLGQIGGRA
jgi:hypothetical protein